MAAACVQCEYLRVLPLISRRCSGKVYYTFKVEIDEQSP